MADINTPSLIKRKELSEEDFYRMYFNLENIDKDELMALSQQEIALAAIICAKPFSFKLKAGNYSKGESLKYILAKDLDKYYPGFKIPAVYGVLSNLKRKGILIDNGDLLEPSADLQNVRQIIKAQLIKYKVFNFNYTVNFTIGYNNTTTGTAETTGERNKHHSRTAQTVG